MEDKMLYDDLAKVFSGASMQDNGATPLSQALEDDLTEGNKILYLLNVALNDELLASYQYRTCYWASRGKGKSDCDPEFSAHYKEEEAHAEKLMGRINELGGMPTADPTNWKTISNGFTPIDFSCVHQMLVTTIDAEKTAIQHYKTLAAASADGIDPTTNHLAEEILADEEKHLYDLQVLFGDIFGDSGE